MHAKVIIRRVIVTPEEGPSILLLELDIDCQGCGQTQGTIHGHHLATLHKVLGEIIAEHPGLCGEVGTVKDVTSFQSVVDPQKVSLN